MCLENICLRDYGIYKSLKLFLDCRVSARRGKFEQKVTRCPRAAVYVARLTSLVEIDKLRTESTSTLPLLLTSVTDSLPALNPRLSIQL